MQIHLSALKNVSCWAFRKLCTGATDSYTSMLSMGNLIRKNAAWEEVDTYPIEGQRQWIQVTTSREKLCGLFLDKLNNELKTHPEKDNVYGIQVNFSCPSAELINSGQGPALIKRPNKVSNIVKKLLKQNKFKVGIKVRLGLNEKEAQEKVLLRLFDELSKIKNPNFEHVAVHFKHAKESSYAKYDYSLLKELVKFNLPIIINGGISEIKDVKEILKDVDTKNIVGFMVGREAVRDPSCFKKFSNSFNKTSLKSKDYKELNKDFDDFILEHSPKQIYLKTIKKVCLWRALGMK